MSKKKNEDIYIGMASTTISIWMEYKTLVDNVFESYKADHDKFNSTTIPLLHLMSHAVEIGLKENIIELEKIFPEHNPDHKFKEYSDFEKSHEGWKLLHLFKSYMSHAFKVLPSIPSSQKKHYLEKIQNLGEFISEVNPHTTTYRYEYYLTHEGKKERSIDWKKRIDIYEVYKSFTEAQTLLLYTLDLYHPYFGYKILKNEFPEYNRGVGRLALSISRWSNNPEISEKISLVTKFLEKHKFEGSSIYYPDEERQIIQTKIPGKLFFNIKSGENLEFLEVKDAHFLNVISKDEALYLMKG